MILFNLICSGLLIIVYCNVVTQSEKVDVPIEMIRKLAKLVEDDQVGNVLSSHLPPPLYRQAGLYSSFAKNNFHGKPNSAIGRTVGVFDNNLFTTNFINTMLLESSQRGAAPKPSSKQIRMSLDLGPLYIDKNRPYDNSIIAYWPVAYDKSAQFWQSHPENNLMLFDLLKAYKELPIYQMVKMFGFSEIGDFINYVENNSVELKSITIIPMDIDCTFINLGMGSALLSQNDEYPLQLGQWKAFNTNISSAFEAVKEYSYRPFSGNRDSNSIDPRTYFVFRDFLDEAYNAGNDVALPTTWTQSQSELAWQRGKGMAMFRNVNNVCLGVTANVVYGFTSSILSGLVDISILNDPLIAQIYHNSTALLLHSMKHNMTGRPDLALVYYPSRVQVEWFMSRSLAKLEDASRDGLFSSPILVFVYEALQEALRVHVTDRLLEEAQQEEQKTVFFEEFLGTDDYSASGQAMKTGEDRIFSTAMALNVLINSWTSFNSGKQVLEWIADTPHHVIVTVNRAALWLMQNTFGGNYKPGGAFFAGSYKWQRTWPNYYPGNRYQFYNGTPIHDWQSQEPSIDTAFFMEGHVSAENYAAMLDQRWFGRTPPRDFHGYNKDNRDFFIYWESEPLTYTITLSGLSMYRNIDNNLF